LLCADIFASIFICDIQMIKVQRFTWSFVFNLSFVLWMGFEPGQSVGVADIAVDSWWEPWCQSDIPQTTSSRCWSANHLHQQIPMNPDWSQRNPLTWERTILWRCPRQQLGRRSGRWWWRRRCSPPRSWWTHSQKCHKELRIKKISYFFVNPRESGPTVHLLYHVKSRADRLKYQVMPEINDVISPKSFEYFFQTFFSNLKTALKLF